MTTAADPKTMASRFRGTHTALVTPFKGNAVAYDDLKKLVDFQIEQGIDGLVSVGTTGESPTLETEEHIEVIARTVRFARGRVPVIAGTGSNSTKEAVELTQAADRAGADAFLLVAPYYNKPGADGLFEHFAAIARVTKKPIILYSVAKRCGIDIPFSVVERLRKKKEFKHIIGFKEASGSFTNVSELVRAFGDDFIVLSGDDGLTLPFMSLGARGLISVASNWLPAQVSALVRHALAGDFASALQAHNKLADVFSKIFTETSPVPIKYLLKKARLIGSDKVRPPLSPLKKETAGQLDGLFEKMRKTKAV